MLYSIDMILVNYSQCIAIDVFRGLQMKNNKLHKLDWILLGGMGLIGLIGVLLDLVIIRKINFPIYSIESVYVSYVLWIILLIYSFFKNKGNQDKPKLVRWYIGFALPYFHCVFIIAGFAIVILFMKLFNL